VWALSLLGFGCFVGVGYVVFCGYPCLCLLAECSEREVLEEVRLWVWPLVRGWIVGATLGLSWVRALWCRSGRGGGVVLLNFEVLRRAVFAERRGSEIRDLVRLAHLLEKRHISILFALWCKTSFVYLIELFHSPCVDFLDSQLTPFDNKARRLKSSHPQALRTEAMSPPNLPDGEGSIIDKAIKALEEQGIDPEQLTQQQLDTLTALDESFPPASIESLLQSLNILTPDDLLNRCRTLLAEVKLFADECEKKKFHREYRRPIIKYTSFQGDVQGDADLMEKVCTFKFIFSIVNTVNIHLFRSPFLFIFIFLASRKGLTKGTD
jgi:hypothetical protein